jgi:glycine betaine/proline transport system substrate-binding protein
MKTVKNLWIGLSMIVVMAMVLAVGLACEQETDEGVDEPETRGTLYLVDQDWNGQLATTAVAQILLEQEMDHTVATKFAPADSAPLFIGLERGDFHYACCNWPSYSAALLEEYVDAEDGGKVERMGTVGITGETGWYVPSYVIHGDADRGIDAVAPDLRTVSDLNKYKSIFATSDTGTKGRLLEFTAAWDTKPEERLEAFGADFQVVFAGSEGAALAEVDAAFQRGEPFLTYLWEPHWAHAKYNLVQIEMPPLTDDCYPAGNADFFECGWPADDVAKLVWPGLNEEFPEVYEFLSNFQMTNAQQNEMVLNVTDNEITPLEAAQAWVDANEDVWKEWIP